MKPKATAAAPQDSAPVVEVTTAVESNNIVAYLGKAAERVITNNFTGEGSNVTLGQLVMFITMNFNMEWIPPLNVITFHVKNFRPFMDDGV